jgi:hypothetical protein
MITKEEIKNRFEWMFKDLKREWPIYYGIACGDGWNKLIFSALEEIEYIDKDKTTRIFQIKEKFGGLRIYVPLNEEIHELAGRIIHTILNYAESQSFYTCEVCGSYGQRRKGPWVRTLCEECHTKNKRPYDTIQEEDRIKTDDGINEVN